MIIVGAAGLRRPGFKKARETSNVRHCPDRKLLFQTIRLLWESMIERLRLLKTSDQLYTRRCDYNRRREDYTKVSFCSMLWL
jgi:hypothetical protein